MNKYAVVVLVLFFSFLIISCSTPNAPSSAAEKATVFKSQSCGCCGLYIRYLGQQDLTVETVDVPDMTVVKNQQSIPSSMQSCHTTTIGNYFVEGHIPIEAIEKLMTEKPNIKGIALPDMPSGSPGMPGSKQGPFIIYALGNDGSVGEFMRMS